MRNNDLQIKLEYFSEDYDEEREMKPRPRPARAVTPPLQAASPRVCRRRERVVGFEETQNRLESRVKRNNKGGRPSEEAPRRNGSQNVNLPLLLAAHIRQLMGFPLQTLTGNPSIGRSFANLPHRGNIPSTFTNGNKLPQNGFTHLANILSNSHPFYTQPMYTFPNMPAYANQNSTGLFLNPLGLVTPFICWIEDYPLSDGLKMPSHIGSYDRKGDPDHFLHLFEVAIRMHKWLMLVAGHMFTYTLKDSARIWWNSQKASSILDFEDLNILGLYEAQRIFDFIHGLRTRSLVEHLSTDLPLTYKGLMKKTYTGSKQERWPLMASQVIEEIVSKDQRNPPGTTSEDRKTKTGSPPIEDRATTCSPIYPKVQEKFLPQKEPQKASNHLLRCSEENDHKIPPSTIISMKITDMIPMISTPQSPDPRSHKFRETFVFGERHKEREGKRRLRMKEYHIKKHGLQRRDYVSTSKKSKQRTSYHRSCDIRKKSRTSIHGQRKHTRGKCSWSVGEVPLEITIGEHPISRIETLNFVIIKSDSPHNMLMGRTSMQKMGIVVSTIHRAIKFHTKKGAETALSVGEAREEKRRPEGPLPSATTKSKWQEGDKEKTTFFVEEIVFCYRKMPFGLKNTRATYQKLVDKVFNKQIRKNLKAYVDDTIIKSTSEEGMLSDIQETFKRFRLINIKLNLKKCSFGVEEGLILGHLIAKKGTKANPSKIKAITELEQPQTLKDIQSLKKKLATFSRFLSKGAERSLPFFKVLKSCKGKKIIHWTDEADKSFKEMKKFIQALPMLIAPRAGETLIMYPTASKESINAVLFTKRSKGQILIYFVSRVLQGAKLNYPVLEKLILALVHAARRLRRYFQAHTIMVLTGKPIKQALTGPETTRRVAKWAIKLGKHDIVFLKRDERETPADFVPKIPFDDSEKRVKEKEVLDPSNEWKLYTDRASSSDGAGAGLTLIDLACKEYNYALRFEFETTNNEAEYEALLVGLRIAQEMEIKKVAIFLDSQLVVNQIKGTYAVKKLSIKSYLQKVKTALKGFEGYTVLVEVLDKRSIEEKEVLKVEIKEKRSWMSPIQEYLLSGLLLEDTKEARKKIRIQVPQYKLIRDNLYKRSIFTQWLRCIAPPQTNKIIKEIHEGSCGFNVEPHSMVVRITKQGYYWPSMHMKAVKIIQDCDKCKEQSEIRAGMDGAIIVESTWPFRH
uniref:Reverse transcriptase domain-containing protein n=1 Tax=Tanacetum cinerariifolium TaxID=118510 RepID=A0A6L2LGQ4_TANCI|nr:reverse transcriptase domain-containing protein [Tanacetum cinerariifolium]